MFESLKIRDIINSEGYILRIMKKKNVEIGETSLYLEGTYQGVNKIYCKTNKRLLELYFQNQIQTKDLFEVRMDEPYFIRVKERIRRVRYSERFRREVLSSIECGDQFFRELPKGMGCSDPDDILNFVNESWLIWSKLF